jgi:hypothetical protein
MSGIARLFVGAAFASLSAIAGASAVLAQATEADRYTYCAFRPQASSCEAVYRHALTDPTPAADAVKAAFEGYGRYVRNANGVLTDDDRRYLVTSGIQLPDLTPQDQAGLHWVINDPSVQQNADAKRVAVINFLGRAVQAELYCNFNNCKDDERTAIEGIDKEETG